MFKPVKVSRERRLSYAEVSMLHLMIPLAGGGGEHVILPNVQLFGVILKPAKIFLSLGIPLQGWLLEYSRRVILLIVNLVLPSVGLRPALWSRVGKTTERDLA